MKMTASKPLSLIEALALLSPGSSKATLRSWLKQKRVTIDNVVVTVGNSVVEKGQTVALTPRPRLVKGKVKILYQDKNLVVIEKPARILSVAAAYETEETIHAFLKVKFRLKRVYPVHRLDQETSGVMLFALSEKSRDRLKKMFEKHDIERTYVAIVEGSLKQKKGTWKSFLYEDKNYVVHSTQNPKKGKIAITHYEVKKKTASFSWLCLKLETGRKNQIRVHCQKAKHSIAGDQKYGAKTDPIRRLCLHAQTLNFFHPITRKKMFFESPIPTSFYRVMKDA